MLISPIQTPFSHSSPSMSFSINRYLGYSFFDSCIRFFGVCVALVLMATIVAPVTIVLKPFSYYMVRIGKWSEYILGDKMR